ncbi:MAG: PEP-CTERM sorting domain-containing protein [Cyanobacteria bacterium J06632_3]
MNRLITSTTAGCVFAAGFMVTAPATASTFVGDYEVSTSGTVTVDEDLQWVLPFLGLPSAVDINAASTGSFSIDPDRFLDGDLTFALGDLGSSFISIAFPDVTTSDITGLESQFDDAFDYTLSGSGGFTSASANESVTIDYDSGLNEVIIDGFDASSCLTETCIGTIFSDFSLSVNVAAFDILIDSLVALPIPIETQETLATIQDVLPIFGSGDVPLLAGSFTTNFEISPTSVIAEGIAGNYGVLVETGEVTVTDTVTETLLFQESLTEPMTYGDFTPYVATADTADVPEPGALLGLLATGSFAWRQRRRTEKKALV